jgi:hypothetical protein
VPTLFDQTFTWVGEGPGTGVPTIVSLGDSTISGEGGRWAGNTNVYDGRDDAGSAWYWDGPTGETIPDCHRSKSAEVHIGGGIRSKNLACSAAETSTYDWQYPRGWRFKPGVDLFCERPATGGDCMPDRYGQLLSLYHYAIHNNVKAVVVAVGANDFDFSGVTKKCMEQYDEMKFFEFPVPELCSSRDFFTDAITAEKKSALEEKIFTSLKTLTNVMEWAGYDKSDYTVVLQNYWSAIPDDALMRIPDVGTRRRDLGGCPILQGDATPLNTQLLKAINDTVFKVATRFRAEPWWPHLKLMNVQDALVGHRLCEKGVGLIEDIPGFGGLGTAPYAADKVEWVAEARSASVVGQPYTLAEGGHANYWGQLAERNCLRELYRDIITNAGYSPKDPLLNGGRCVPARNGGVNAHHEPNMTLQPLQAPYAW